MRIEIGVGLDQLDECVAGANGEKELILPGEFQGLRVGLLSRLVQTLITVLKQNPQLIVYFPHLRFSDDEHTAKKITEILADPQVLPAILMSSEVLAWQQKPIKNDMQRFLVERFERPVHVSGKVLQLMAVDHSIERLSHPESFYSQDTEGTTYTVRGGEYYAGIISHFLSDKVRQSSFSTDEILGLGDLIAELVENTEQHAKSEYISGQCSRSVRGVIIKSVTVNADQNASSVSRKGERVYEYLASLTMEDKPLHFVELSVFDSGAGIAASYPSYDDTFEQEVDLVLDSFKKGVTSKPDGSGYGRGLDIALRIINSRGGFISVRSGRLSLYRDFHNMPIVDNDLAIHNGRFFLDERAGEGDCVERQNVAGVAYTILVPAK